LPSLLDEFAGSIDLVYIDPPFATGDDFSYTARVPGYDEAEDESETVFVKEPGLIEQKAYRDTWGVSREAQGRGATSLDTYLRWFSETAVLLRELLSSSGSLYVHLDWHVSHYAKAVLDEVFGSDGFLNAIVWQRTGAHNDSRRFGNVADDILFYSKTKEYIWNVQRTAYTQEYVDERFRAVEEGTGRRYWLNTATAAGQGPPRYFNGRLRQPPPGTHWRYSQETIDEFVASGKIVFTDSGMPYVKQYLYKHA
jgi:adenine-specific DNA-methyltransferase